MFVDKWYIFFEFVVMIPSPHVLYILVLIGVIGEINNFGTCKGPLVIEEMLLVGLLLQPLECWLNIFSAWNECLHEVQRNASCSFLKLIFICYAALTVAPICLELIFSYLFRTSSTVVLRDALSVLSNRMMHCIRKSLYVFLPVAEYFFEVFWQEVFFGQR